MRDKISRIDFDTTRGLEDAKHEAFLRGDHALIKLIDGYQDLEDAQEKAEDLEQLERDYEELQAYKDRLEEELSRREREIEAVLEVFRDLIDEREGKVFGKKVALQFHKLLNEIEGA